MYSNFNNKIYPNIKSNIDLGLENIKNIHNNHRREFNEEFKKLNDLNRNFYYKKESIFCDLKQLELNLMRKKDNYGLYCSALNRALERTNKRINFDYDNYFRFRNSKKDREYNFLGNDNDKENFLENDNNEFDMIYKRNDVRLRELNKGVQKSKVFLKFKEKDTLSDYLENYVTKMKYFK